MSKPLLAADERAAAGKLLQIVGVFADDPSPGSSKSPLMVLRRCLEHFWEGPRETGPFVFSRNYREHYFWSCEAVNRAAEILEAPEDENNKGHNRGLVKEHVVPVKWIGAALLAERQEGRLKTQKQMREFLSGRFVVAVVTKAQDKKLRDAPVPGWDWNDQTRDNVWIRYRTAAKKHPGLGLELERFRPYRDHNHEKQSFCSEP